jgi:hypothetical protein
MVRFEEFDVAELSLSTYVLTAQRDAPFVAIPVFTSREFRHNGIYVHPGAGVDSPQDLVGRRVGVAEYQLTANVWIRGILADLLRAGLAVLRRQGRAGPALTAYLRRQRSGRTTPAPTLRPHIRGAAALAA